jgi:glycosyltransferase involved in cell wall biosynthesis
MTTQRLSVVIPTFNVADNIGRCLDSLTWADEVIVVDMGSEDATKEICNRYENVRFIERKDYIFGNVNFGIDQAKNDWVMRHDSDETIPEPLRDEIVRMLAKDGDGYDGFYVAQRVLYFGRWLPEGKPGKSGREKLFRKGHFRYPVKSEHEQPEVTGRWGHLKNPYLHYSHPTVSGWIERMNYYTDRDVERVASPDPKTFAWYKFFTTPFHVFRYHYFRTGLWRHGRHGFVLSLLNAVYALTEKAKLWEKHYKAKKNPDA